MWLGVLILLVTIFFILMKSPVVRAPLLTGLILRLLALCWHVLVQPLPGSQADALTFYNVALEWSFLPIFDAYPGFSSYIYSWIAAQYLKLSGPSQVGLSLVSVSAYVLSCHLIVLIGRELNLTRRNLKIGLWAFSILPASIVYSIFTMREIFIATLVGFVTVTILRWRRTQKNRYLYFSILLSLFACFLHAGFLLLVLALFLAGVVEAAYYKKSAVKWLFAIPKIMIAIVITAFLSNFSFENIPKFRSLDHLTDLTYQAAHIQRKIMKEGAEAAYPKWMSPTSSSQLLWTSAVRIVYFWISPFPFGFSKFIHLIGLLDGIVYGFLLARIWRVMRREGRQGTVKFLILVFGLTMIAFALGTTNFGTAQRHRFKFILLLLPLALSGGRDSPKNNRGRK